MRTGSVGERRSRDDDDGAATVAGCSRGFKVINHCAKSHCLAKYFLHRAVVLTWPAKDALQ